MTSGSSGDVRGVVITHRNPLVADALARALVLSGIAAGTTGPTGSLTVSDTGPADLVLDDAGPVTTRHDIADLCGALGHVLAGRAVTVTPLLSPTLPQLTHREREILGLLTAGASNDTMAGALGISPHTVRTHVQNLLGKLGADSRLAAAALARRHGLARAT